MLNLKYKHGHRRNITKLRIHSQNVIFWGGYLTYINECILHAMCIYTPWFYTPWFFYRSSIEK